MFHPNRTSDEPIPDTEEPPPSKNEEQTWTKSYLARDGFSWAKLFIDSKGAFSVLSDFGCYGHHWSSWEGDFRAFLLRTQDDYVLSKLTPTNWVRTIQIEPSKDAIIETIDSLLRKDCINFELARSALKEVRSEEEMTAWIHDVWFGSLDLHTEPPIVTRNRPPLLEHFMLRLWPQLKAAIQEDLDATTP